jgi:hypothetical protein
MNPVIKASVALAVLVEVVSVIFAAIGLHQSSPMIFGIAFLVLAIGLNIGCVIWALSGTAAESGYGRQLLNAAIFGLVAGGLIILFSMLNTMVLFPNYLEESGTASIEFMESMNMPEEALQAQIESIESRTPVGEAIKGGIGTIVTSLVVGAIVAIFKRKK